MPGPTTGVKEYVRALARGRGKGAAQASCKQAASACAGHTRSCCCHVQAVISWGDPTGGGNQSAVNDALQSGVASVVGNRDGRAFAAIKLDGTVLAWGDPNSGGDASAVQAQLVDIITIYAHPKT